MRSGFYGAPRRAKAKAPETLKWWHVLDHRVGGRPTEGKKEEKDIFGRGKHV